MPEPYVGEIRMFGGNFAPAGWAFCDGQSMPISENETLFTLIGTTYGGDGQETFNLPDLRSRVPIHHGTASSGVTYPIAQMGGVESVTLTTNQIPIHRHALVASASMATESSPAGNVIAQSAAIDLYVEDDPVVALAATSVGPAGGSQPHDNLQPHLAINFIISLFGLWPSPT